MEDSIAVATGATSGLGHALARLLAKEGWHEIIVTERSLVRIQDTTAQLADRPSSTDCRIAPFPK